MPEPPRRVRASLLRLLPLAVVGVVCLGGFAPRQSDCAVDEWADDVVSAWRNRGTLANAPCYAASITSMDTARTLRDRVVERFDRMLPRAGYKVVGLDPVNAALPGVDRPMVGVMYVGMFLPTGATIPMESAAQLITEPDLLVSVADELVNDARTLEELLPHLDRVYAFIEVPAPLFANAPPNPFLMQASNLLPRWGVIGDSVRVRPSEQFLRSLETMTVTFRDGERTLLEEQPGAYLGGNPLNGVLVVLEELRRRGERLRPGDLVSAGSFMPPIPVTEGLYTEAVYANVGGTTLRVTARYR